MAALTLFFDYNIGKRVPKALRAARPPAVAIKDHLQVGFAKEAPDDEWLAKVGTKGWVVITHDRKFHKRELEIAAIKAHSVRCFYLRGGSDPTWNKVYNFVSAFPRIVEIADQVPAPFIYQVKGRRVWPAKI